MRKRSCHSCHHLRRYAEDFEGRYYSFDCNKHKQLANLRSFPFKNGCEGYDENDHPTTPTRGSDE
jgi:hypothetical protein